MNKEKIKELLIAVRDGHKSFRECMKDIQILEYGMIAAITALATALNDELKQDLPVLDVESSDSN